MTSLRVRKPVCCAEGRRKQGRKTVDREERKDLSWNSGLLFSGRDVRNAWLELKMPPSRHLHQARSGVLSTQTHTFLCPLLTTCVLFSPTTSTPRKPSCFVPQIRKFRGVNRLGLMYVGESRDSWWRLGRQPVIKDSRDNLIRFYGQVTLGTTCNDTRISNHGLCQQNSVTDAKGQVQRKIVQGKKTTRNVDGTEYWKQRATINHRPPITSPALGLSPIPKWRQGDWWVVVQKWTA